MQHHWFKASLSL